MTQPRRNPTRLASHIAWIREADSIARFDHLNSVARNRPKPPATPPVLGPTPVPLPTPAWRWDPTRPGWRMTVTGSAQQEPPHPASGTGHPLGGHR